jgi:hypothetical protein
MNSSSVLTLITYDELSMRMVKQARPADGAIAMDCGVCVIAMLTDLPYKKIVADMPEYRKTTDHDWMRYLKRLGFQVNQVDENAPPLGWRLYCGIAAVLNDKTIPHAIAVDESGCIFDPANGAPEPGKFTLEECVSHGTFRIHCCFAVIRRGISSATSPARSIL